MKISGIIAEYNPFHNGHALHIARTRKNGATHIVCAMSGYFTQRGDIAVQSKRSRAQAALAGGADLVLELPLPWAAATAEKFAWGGVSVLRALGCVQELSFGSETSDIAQLQKVADALDSSAVQQALKHHLSSGMTFARARQQAVAQSFDDDAAAVLRSPNSTLAIEYLRALRSLAPEITPFAVQREGVAHDADTPCSHTASASLLRSWLHSGDLARLQDFMPLAAFNLLHAQCVAGRAPVFMDGLSTALLARLRTMEPNDFTCLPDLSEGLERRILKASRVALSPRELHMLAKTKRYTLARIRRICLAALLGITPAHFVPQLPYVRILGLNERGQDVLRLARNTALVPLIQRAGLIAPLGPDAATVFELERKAGDLFALAMPVVAPCGAEYTEPVVRWPNKL